MEEILIACGDVELLKKIVGALPEGKYKPIATKTGEGIARKIAGRGVPVAIVHRQLQDDYAGQLCQELGALDRPPKVLLLAEDPPADGPFDRANKYPVPGPVLRNALKGVLQADEAGEDLDKWKAFYKEVKARLKKTPDQDYYQMLGLATDAPHHAIVDAFDKISLRYHPDRYKQYRDRKWGQALFEKVNQLYTILTEAYQVLSDRKLRSRYDRLRKKGERRMPADELSSPESGPESLTEAANSKQAKKYLKMAQTEIAKKNWQGALQNLQFASSIEPDNQLIAEKLDEIQAKLD